MNSKRPSVHVHNATHNEPWVFLNLLGLIMYVIYFIGLLKLYRERVGWRESWDYYSTFLIQLYKPDGPGIALLRARFLLNPASWPYTPHGYAKGPEATYLGGIFSSIRNLLSRCPNNSTCSCFTLSCAVKSPYHDSLAKCKNVIAEAVFRSGHPQSLVRCDNNQFVAFSNDSSRSASSLPLVFGPTIEVEY